MGLEWFGSRFLNHVENLYANQAMAYGEEVVRLAKIFAPVDTGRLRDSIYWTWLPSERKLSIHVDVPYGMHQEFGTFRMPPHPYIRPALRLAKVGIFRGFNLALQMETNMSPSHVPLKIMRHIRPLIAAANYSHNRGIVRKASLTAVHVRQKRANYSLLQTSSSNLSHVLKRKTAWN